MFVFVFLLGLVFLVSWALILGPRRLRSYLGVELFASYVDVVGAGLVLNVNDDWHFSSLSFFIFSLRRAVLHCGLAD
jgi:hypothetical protein